MTVQPTPAPRAETLWQRQQSPLDSVISDILGGGGAASDTIISSQEPSSSSTTTSSSSSSSSSSTRTTSSSSSSSSSTSTSTSSTPTSTTSSSTSSSSTVITTSSPSTLITTSNVVSGTSTSQVVITTVVTPVVTATVGPSRSASNRSASSNGAMIGGIVGGVVGGLALLALLIAICVLASRRRSRTGHAYFLCFGQRPSRAAKGELGHSGGAWPTFDPKDEYGGPSYAAAAVGSGAAVGAAAASRRNRRRREHTQATLPEQFVNEDDPERYGRSPSSAAHDAYNNGAGYDGYDGGYNAYNVGNGAGGYPEMAEGHGGAAGALAAGAAAGGAGAYFAKGHNRRSSAGHPSYGGSGEAYSPNNMSPGPTGSNEHVPAPWTLPMMGWNDTHGPYSVAGVGHQQNNGSPAPAPQAQFMVSPSEANAAAAAMAAAAASRPSPGPDYSHFDPPEVRDARAREAAAAALARGNFSSPNSHPAALMPGVTSPRRQNRRLSSPNNGSPTNDHAGLAGSAPPPAYVDAQDGLEEVAETPRRLHLTNAEPEMTDEESSRGGPSRRPLPVPKDLPPSATYRQN
ncbi:hypothetical protein BCV70DRAFT_201523 [Testicularia cyperi]|uniref:REJ domain-containing protein n=1 Tax=Testicularia cyperi TaxID=1882483 RepID=A0A317XK84_9BASI|nr:hypothetical protein BCV70DRAFT_201523 [Testicularia cyperi]